MPEGVSEPMLGADASRPNNVRALGTALGISALWTAAQLTGALLANSSSLLSDGLAMCVDVCAYGLNLASEVRSAGRACKLVAPFVSAVALLLVTAYSVADALGDLREGGAKKQVDGRLVLGFGLAMLFADLAMLGAIFFRGSAARLQGSPFGAVCSVSRKSELNLFSGLAHVLADTLRSLTQVAVGVVILAGGPSNIVDGCGTLAISSTILLGALFLLYEVGVQWRHAMECARCNGGDASYTQWL